MSTHPRDAEMLLHRCGVVLDHISNERPTVVDELPELLHARPEQLEHAVEPVTLGRRIRVTPQSGVGEERLHARRKIVERRVA